MLMIILLKKLPNSNTVIYYYGRDILIYKSDYLINIFQFISISLPIKNVIYFCKTFRIILLICTTIIIIYLRSISIITVD